MANPVLQRLAQRPAPKREHPGRDATRTCLHVTIRKVGHEHGCSPIPQPVAATSRNPNRSGRLPLRNQGASHQCRRRTAFRHATHEPAASCDLLTQYHCPRCYHEHCTYARMGCASSRPPLRDLDVRAMREFTSRATMEESHRQRGGQTQWSFQERDRQTHQHRPLGHRTQPSGSRSRRRRDPGQRANVGIHRSRH